MDLIRVLIAILLPPLGVFLQVGFGGAFWLNVLLAIYQELFTPYGLSPSVNLLPRE